MTDYGLQAFLSPHLHKFPQRKSAKTSRPEGIAFQPNWVSINMSADLHSFWGQIATVKSLARTAFGNFTGKLCPKGMNMSKDITSIDLQTGLDNGNELVKNSIARSDKNLSWYY